MTDDSPAPGDDIDFGQTVARFRGGVKIFGRYTLERQLGRGGMGVVWLARDHSLDRPVAFKFLPDIMLQDRSALDDLRQETRRNLEITHPHIVRIYDFEEDGALAGIAMEYVDGDTLAARRSAQLQRVFNARDLLPWLKDLCEALYYAHTDPRVVHRDLKPANLMVSARGQIKITDFGIARSITDSMSRVSNAHATGGTLAYMSPQQLLGADATACDDIYSVGATLYDLLTSKPPFFTGSVAHQIQHVAPPRMEVRRAELKRAGEPIPNAWEEVVQACLAKEPHERPESTLAIYDRIQAGSGAGTSRRSFPPVEPARPPPGSPRGTILSLAGLIAVLAALALAFFAWKNGAGLRYSNPQHAARIVPIQTATPAPAPPEPAPPKIAVPSKGSIIINTLPSRALVFLDGRSAGLTPVLLEEVSTGLRQMRLTLDGYEAADLTLDVNGGQRIEKTVHLVARKLAPAVETPSPLIQPAPASPQIPPLPPAPTENLLSDEAVGEFVRVRLVATERNDIDTLVNGYSSPVDYHDEGHLSRAALRASLAKYQRDWPSVDIGDLSAINVRSTSDPDVKLVSYSYFFVATNSRLGKISQGRAHDQLTVRAFKGGIFITKFRQTISNRKKNY